MTRATPIPETMTLHVPFRVVKRGGRKEMQLPEGAAQPRKTDSSLVKALARAFRWKRILESGDFTTIAELAEREGIAPSYMTRVLRLTLLAPNIVEAILDGKQGPEVTLPQVLASFPAEWKMQGQLLAAPRGLTVIGQHTLPAIDSRLIGVRQVEPRCVFPEFRDSNDQAQDRGRGSAVPRSLSRLPVR